MSVKPYRLESLEKCPGNVKEDEGETSNVSEYKRCNLEAILAFSKYTEEANKRERCNLDDVEG